MKKVEENLPKRIAIIDDDMIVCNLVSNYARSLGVKIIDKYSGIDEFWEVLESGSKKYDLLVIDWKLPGINGVGLFNRLKNNDKYKDIPILIVSGFLNKYDFALLDEFSGTLLLEKPFTQQQLGNMFGELLIEQRWHQDKIEVLENLVNEMSAGKADVFKNILRILSESPNPIAIGILIAKKLRKSNFLKEARSILEYLLKSNHGSIMAMGELGKVLFQLGKVEEARKILQATQKVSPENIKRLCLLGEIELNLLEPESARSYFERALEIDPENYVANSGMITADNLQEHLISYPKDSITTSFAGLLNIIAITKVREGSYEEGIEQYQAALAFLTDSESIAKVSFNLGLGFLRWNRLEMALDWFVKSRNANKKNFLKATYYINRITENGYEVVSENSDGIDDFSEDMDESSYVNDLSENADDSIIDDESFDVSDEDGMSADTDHFDDLRAFHTKAG
ncbi:MAG: response regulator [Bdellovibrionota bacterium]